MAGSKLFAKKRPLRTNLPVNGDIGETVDLRRDVGEALDPLVAVTVDEFTNPPAASTTGILPATATVAAPVTVAASGLVGGAAVVLPYARPIQVTTAGATPADAPATVTVTGTDINGKVQTETINVPQTATSALGTKCFKTVTGLSFPAADGTAATVAIGWGAPLGLTYPAKSRAGAVISYLEVSAGARVTNGTLSDGATNAPNGMYTPNAAANGTNDYAVSYEYVPA